MYLQFPYDFFLSLILSACGMNKFSLLIALIVALNPCGQQVSCLPLSLQTLNFVGISIVVCMPKLSSNLILNATCKSFQHIHKFLHELTFVWMSALQQLLTQFLAHTVQRLLSDHSDACYKFSERLRDLLDYLVFLPSAQSIAIIEVTNKQYSLICHSFYHLHSVLPVTTAAIFLNFIIIVYDYIFLVYFYFYFAFTLRLDFFYE